MSKIFVLVNPASANGSTRQVWPEISKYLKHKGLEFESALTIEPYQAPELVRAALQRGFETVVAIGGDGTVNEVVNGFFDGGEAINPEARLAIISRGTGCDLIRTLGIPKDYKEAIDRIVANRECCIDLGQVEFTAHDGSRATRWFVNIADAGLGGTVANRVNHTSKSAGGFLSFFYGTLWSILSYRSAPAKVIADGKEVYAGSLAMAGLANGCYLGGGMHLSPDSQLDDGLLDLVVIQGMPKPILLANLAKVYKGTHLSHPKIFTLPAREVVIEAERPLLLELDGEAPGTTPARFSVRPQALRVLV